LRELITKKIYDNQVTIQKMVMKKHIVHDFSFYIH